MNLKVSFSFSHNLVVDTCNSVISLFSLQLSPTLFSLWNEDMWFTPSLHYVLGGLVFKSTLRILWHSISHKLSSVLYLTSPYRTDCWVGWVCSGSSICLSGNANSVRFSCRRSSTSTLILLMITGVSCCFLFSHFTGFSWVSRSQKSLTSSGIFSFVKDLWSLS